MNPHAPGSGEPRRVPSREPRTDQGVAELPAAGASVLDAAAAAFAALVTGPAPLALDAASMRAAGSPHRVTPVDEVRELLLDRAVGYEARDRIWAAVVDRARAGDPAWTVAAVGLALPKLRRIAATFARTVPAGHVPDVESELLAGYLAELRVIDAGRGRVAARLCWAAYRAADRYRRSDPARAGVVVPLTESAAPQRPWGHPDLVLAAAVTGGVLTQYEAELIGTTRLENTTLDDLATAWGLPRSTLAGDRARAERRLIAALQAAGKVTVGSRSGSAPDLAAADPDSEGAEATRPAGAPSSGSTCDGDPLPDAA